MSNQALMSTKNHFQIFLDGNILHYDRMKVNSQPARLSQNRFLHGLSI